MANTTSANGTSQKRTAAEIKAWYEQHKTSIEKFEKMQNGLQLINPNKTQTRSYTIFSLETLRRYMKNPAAYYKNIIELSNFLYTRSHSYRKLINYNASMIDVNYRAIIPISDFTKKTNKKELLNDFYEVCSIMQPMSWQSEVYKMNIISWLDDTSYGIIYTDDTGVFILPIDYKYAKVDGVFTDSSLSFAIDMSYYDNRQDELEMLGEPLTGMYKEYLKDKINNKWVSVPEKYSYCTKINLNDVTLPLPSYLPIFTQALRLASLEDIQSIKDESSIYKLLSFELETNGDEPDSFTVDVDTAIDYFNKAVESLPDYVAAVLTPVKINPITFQSEDQHDMNVIDDGIKNLYSSANGAQILYSSNISNGTAWEGAMIADEKYATSLLRPQIQIIMNRWLRYQTKANCTIKLLPVSEYSKRNYKEGLVKDFQYGLPLRLALNTLNGFNEIETISMARLENDVLGLNNIFLPPQSANTMAGEAGRPKVDNPSNLSPEGEATRDGDKNDK